MRTKKLSLSVKFAGIKFRSPFIISSGPVSKNVEEILQAEEAGWAGTSIKLTMEPEPYINLPPRYKWFKDLGYHMFTLEKRLTLKEGLRLVNEGRKRTKKIIIMANIAYFGKKGLKGWGDMAKKFEDAGTHAIEINFCCPNMSYNIEAVNKRKKTHISSGASLGRDLDAVKAITTALKKSVGIPVITKLTPEGDCIAEAAKVAVEAGADGVCSVGNTLGIPPFDIHNMNKSIYPLQKGMSLGCLSGPWLKPLALKNTLQIRKAIGPDHFIIGTGGVQDSEDAIRMTMLGADLIGVCTEVMLRGFGILPKLIKGVETFLKKKNKTSFAEIRDIAIPYFKTAEKISAVSGHAKVDRNRCTGCSQCLKIGHCYAIEVKAKKAIISKSYCQGCSTCVDICPKGAITMVKDQ